MGLVRRMEVGEEVRIGPDVRVAFLGWADKEKTMANIGIDAPRDVPITWDGKGEPRGLAGAVAGRRLVRGGGR